jgi:hypothetical protein
LNIEIPKPEQVQRVTADIQAGHFPDAAEPIEKALDALDEGTEAAAPTSETVTVLLTTL